MSDQLKAFLIALLLVIVFTLFVYGFACILTTSAHATDLSDFAIPQKTDIPADAYGVWQIPNLGISVPVYTHGGQETIDAEESALLTPYGRAFRIGDHRGSGGKWYVENIPLNTIAFMVKRDETIRYRCFAIMKVEVVGSVFGINGRIVTEFSSTDIICSCCAESESERYLAFFRRVS